MSDSAFLLIGLLFIGVVLLVVWLVRHRSQRGSPGPTGSDIQTTGRGATWADYAISGGTGGGGSGQWLPGTVFGGDIGMSEFESRPCRRDALHKPHFWGEAGTGGTPYRCPGVERKFFYRDWEREVRRFHPPGPDQIQAARRLLVALDAWEEMPDTAGSRWAVKFLTWLATYETPEAPAD